MTPEMIGALLSTSLYCSTDTEAVCRQVVEALSSVYNGTGNPDALNTANVRGRQRPSMTMLNLYENSCMRARTVANPHRLFGAGKSLDMQFTLCQHAIKRREPLLVQNASEHPDFKDHPVTRLRLRRYLGVPIWNSEGQPVGTLCLMDDRVEAPLGEADIQFLSLLAMRIGSELEREQITQARIAEKERYATQLERTAEERSSFVSMVIHDLRQPLTAMMTELYMLRTEQNESTRAIQVSALEERVRALSGQLDELLVYNTIEAGKVDLTLDAVDTTGLIESCVSHLTSRIDGRVAVHMISDPNMPPVITDASKLRHIVMNVAGNALKYTQEGCVTIQTRYLPPDGWIFEVTDTGCGFEPGQKISAASSLSAANSASSGTGLGLSIATRLCSSLKGSVSISSRPGVGTSVQITFPTILREDTCSAK